MRLNSIFLWSLVIVMMSVSLASQSYAQTVGSSYFTDPLSPRISRRSPSPTASFPLIQYLPSDDVPDASISLQYEIDINETSLNRHLNVLLKGIAEHSLPFGSQVVDDYRLFYSANNVKLLGGLFLVGGAIANTSLDDSVRDIFVDNQLTNPEHEVPEFLHSNKSWGDGLILLPAYAAISVTGKYLLDDPVAFEVGDWGERTIRGILVGTPPLLLTQKLTGGSRPNETGHGSDWTPWSDDNGVSGHAFMGAVPFLTAAQMSQNRFWKGTFIAASTLPGLSRISDDAHYPSQVFLGWALAWVATSAVNDNEFAGANISIEPIIIDGSTGLGFSIRR